jgi:predicted small secreted protein
MNKRKIFIFLGLSALLLTACNTMEGVGRDIKVLKNRQKIINLIRKITPLFCSRTHIELSSYF